MPEPPYDRALALAAQVRTLRDHYLDVSCDCGAHRGVSLGVMARDRGLATATLAHVALRIACERCHGGPEAVYLCAMVFGRRPAQFGGDVVWTMALVERGTFPSYHLRQGEVEARGLR